MLTSIGQTNLADTVKFVHPENFRSGVRIIGDISPIQVHLVTAKFVSK